MKILAIKFLRIQPPMKTLFGKTWVGWLNVLIIQFFFVRLSYGETPTQWGLLRGIVPCTGWWNDYKFFPKRFSKQFES